MLNCRSVWGFECFVSILCFKFFIHFSLQQTYQKMNHNYFLYLRCFVVVSFVLLGVPDHGAVPNHGPAQGAVCTKQMMVLYHAWCFWTKSWCWTSSICGTSLWIPSLSLRPSKNPKKSLKTYTKKSRETFKKQRKTKRSISRKSGPRYVSSKSCRK